MEAHWPRWLRHCWQIGNVLCLAIMVFPVGYGISRIDRRSYQFFEIPVLIYTFVVAVVNMVFFLTSTELGLVRKEKHRPYIIVMLFILMPLWSAGFSWGMVQTIVWFDELNDPDFRPALASRSQHRLVGGIMAAEAGICFVVCILVIASLRTLSDGYVSLGREHAYYVALGPVDKVKNSYGHVPARETSPERLAEPGGPGQDPERTDPEVGSGQQPWEYYAPSVVPRASHLDHDDGGQPDGYQYHFGFTFSAGSSRGR